MLTDANATETEHDDLAELEAIKSEIERLDIAPALKKLMDLLGRREGSALRYLLAHATELLARCGDLEYARRSGKLSQADFESLRQNLSIEAGGLIAMVRANYVTIAVTGALGRQGLRDPREPAVPQGSIRQPPVDERAVIDARGISKMHKSTSFQLAPLDVRVLPGEILGIVGVNGSGKSTLLDILRGEIAPDKGMVYYPQLSPDNKDWARIRAQIGYVPQRSVSWKGTVRAALEYACAAHRNYGSSNRRRVDMLLARHGLTTYQNHTWGQLSSGYRLRFDLVMARIHNPSLMIFDEPLANLDPVSQQTFLMDLAQLSRGESGIKPAIILSSQHLYELEAVAASMLVLSAGQRVQIVRDRPCSYFEIWGDGLTLDAVKKAFFVLQPDSEAPGGDEAPRAGWDVRIGRTACLIALVKATTVDKVAGAACAANLTLNYIRDVTNSARVELDALGDDPFPLSQERH
jgi:ABC-type multidrug transport system ATPase subunit